MKKAPCKKSYNLEEFPVLSSEIEWAKEISSTFMFLWCMSPGRYSSCWLYSLYEMFERHATKSEGGIPVLRFLLSVSREK